MSYNNYGECRILKTNAGVKTGHPMTGFEKWRENILKQELISFPQYVEDCLNEIKAKGGKVEYGNKINEVFVPAKDGELYTVVKATFPGQNPKFRRVSSFAVDYKKYESEFIKRRNYALGVKPGDDIPFFEGVFI
jgi:hypothetical protein